MRAQGKSEPHRSRVGPAPGNHEIAEEARDLARTQRSTLRDLVVTGLRHEVERRREVTVADFHFPTVAGEGLAIGLPPREAIERSYDLTP